MNPPFEMAWFGTGSHLWHCPETYCLLEYGDVPKIDSNLLQGQFSWLKPLQGKESSMLHEALSAGKHEQLLLNNLTHLLLDCKEKQLQLPDSFHLFFQSPEFYLNIPSSSGCYFDLSRKLLPCPELEDAYLVRFLNDPQGLLYWYLLIHPNLSDCVLACAPEWKQEIQHIEQLDSALEIQDLIQCSYSFEEFIYRYWIENKICFAVEENRALTDEFESYADHVKRQATT